MRTVDPSLAARERATRPVSNSLALGILVIMAISGFVTAATLEAPSDVRPILGIDSTIVGTAGFMICIVGFIAWGYVWPRSATWGLLAAPAASLLGATAGCIAFPRGPIETAIVASLAIVAVTLTIVGTLRRRSQSTRDVEMMATGTLVTARVSDKGYTHFGESSRLITTGQPTRLWFDGQNPGDVKRMVVELALRTPIASR